MDLNHYYPRRVGELFFLVNTRDNAFLRVNEAVYELVSAFKGVHEKYDWDVVLTKYALTRQEFDKYLADIARALHDA